MWVLVISSSGWHQWHSIRRWDWNIPKDHQIRFCFWWLQQNFNYFGNTGISKSNLSTFSWAICYSYTFKLVSKMVWLWKVCKKLCWTKICGTSYCYIMSHQRSEYFCLVLQRRFIKTIHVYKHNDDQNIWNAQLKSSIWTRVHSPFK